MPRAADIIAFLMEQQSSGPDEAECRAALKAYLGSVSVPTRTLHRTYTLVRLRQNSDSKQFGTVAELSYRPPHVTGTAARASTGSRPLFYAASCERRTLARGAFTDIEHGLKIALFETIPFLRDNCQRSRGLVTPEDLFPNLRIINAEQFPATCVTYAFWEAVTDITLANACLDAVHDEDSSSQQILQRLFYRYVFESPFQRTGEDDFWVYVTREFSRLGKRGGSAHLISSIVAEALYDLGCDGVCYPSVRCNGLGMNVALKPKSVDTKLVCTGVGLCNISVDNKELRLDKQRFLRLKPGDNSFNLYAS